jgi:tetratricopeptide (TPR) repeat protein
MTSPSFVRRVKANAEHLLDVVRAIEDREYRTLDPEWPNLQQAIHYGLEYPEAQPAAAALWAVLIGFIESRGYFGAWQTVTEKVAEKIQALPPALACKVANEAGFFFVKINDLSRSLEMHEAALNFAERTRDRFEKALATLGKGGVQTARRVYDEAETLVREAMGILDELDQERLHYSSSVDLMGLIATDRGEYTTAIGWFEQSVQGFLRAGHHRKAAASLTNLALAQDLNTDHRGAIDTLERALKLLKPGIDNIIRTNVYNSLGTSYFHLEDYARAKEAFLKIDQPYLEKHGLLDKLMWVTNNLGNVALKEGAWEAARDYLGYSIGLARKLGHGISLGNSLGDLAEALLYLRERDAAREALDEAVEVLEGYPENAWARKRLAAILAQCKDAFG